jgi:arylformamidase
MEVIDISVPVHPGMVTYPGDPDVRLERVSSIPDGAAYNLSRLAMGVHSGTHVDAPLHFLEGAPAAEALALDVLVGPAVVVDAAAVEAGLSASALRELELPQGADRLLFKTRNSELWSRSEFSDDFVSLTEDGARLLIERGVRLVGIDYLSIGDEGAHVALLEAGVVAIEGLDLRAVEPGQYQLICAPLKLVGAEGAPARALLLRE